MRRLARRIAVVFFAMCCLPETSAAQGRTDAASLPPLPASDSVFRRARRLVGDGNGTSGRALVDSMLHASTEGTPSYGDALFWRGALAETAADAERDYRKVVVEYPLSPYVDDALLSLAELEQARGDRTAAFSHLQRFVREHPVSPARARAGLAAARLAFEQRDVTRGCTMIADARASAGTSDVELRNQIDYYGGRCPTSTVVPVATGTAAVTGGTSSAVPQRTAAPSASTPTASVPPIAVASTVTGSSASATTRPNAPAAATSTKNAAPGVATPSNAATSVSKTPPAKAASAATESTPPKAATAPASRAGWTIQLAAYNTRPDAERLVSKLSGRGVRARISGDAKPFRVRLDFYPTRQAAASAVEALKQRGIIGFVTEEARPSGATSP